MAEQNQLSPEIVILSKRLAQAQSDYDGLRSSMVQQVTHFRKLVKVVFDLDDGYFGGRFQSQEAAGGQQSPQQDLAVALQVVEAVSDELHGATAFADSPLLRDQVANLVAAVDSLREVALDADRAATAAVGFTGQSTAPASFPARTFPENNPLACLTEAVGFLRDLQGLVARLKDRVGALVMMAQEADEARNEAEAATASFVESRSAEKVSASLLAELESRDAELLQLRQSAMLAQDQHAEEIRRITSEIRQRIESAHEGTAREAEQHRGDLAEARSLAAEIERLAAADPESSKVDDLDITLGVLRDSLAGGEGDFSGVIAAAESVLVAWAKIIGERAASAAAELSTLRWKFGEGQAKLEQAQGEVARLTAELKRSSESEKGFTMAREAVSRELSLLRTQVAEQARELHGRDLNIKSKDEATARNQEQLQRTGDELQRERTARNEEQQRHQEAMQQAQAASQQSVAQFEGVIQRSRTAAETAERQLGEVRQQLAAVRGEADGARAETQRLQAEVTRLAQIQQQAQAKEQEAQAQLKQAVAAKQQAETALAAATAAAASKTAGHTELSGELAKLQAALAQATAAREAAERAAKTARDEQQQAVASGLQQLSGVRSEADKAQAEVKRLQAEVVRVAETLRTAEAREQELTAAKQQAETALAAATAKAASGERLQGDVAKLEAALAQATAAREAAERAAQSATAGLAEQQKAATTAQQQLAEATRLRQVAEQQVSTVTARSEELQREIAALSAVRERLVQSDAAASEAKLQLAAAEAKAKEAVADRDRLQADLQRLQSERTARDRRATEAEFERSRTQGALSERESQVNALTATAGNLQRELHTATERIVKADTETTRLRSQLDAAIQAREQAAADLATRLKHEAAAVSERESAKAALAATTAERDRLNAQVARLRGDLEAQTRVLQTREDESGAKLADIARQAGEAKQVAENLTAENTRLRAEIDRAESRSSTDVQKAERKATETQKMAVRLDQELIAARARITELSGELAESQAEAQNILERAETEATLGQASSKRWVQEREELVGLVKAAKTAVQNAKVARESDAQRIADLEGQLAIQAAQRPQT